MYELSRSKFRVQLSVKKIKFSKIDMQAIVRSSFPFRQPVFQNTLFFFSPTNKANVMKSYMCLITIHGSDILGCFFSNAI